MIRLVFSTFADSAQAAAVVRALVEERLTACGSILPGVRSIYRWEGAIEDAGEVMVILKTTVDQCSALQKRLLDLHPYETPEVIVLDPSAVSPAYADWLVQQCAPDGGEERLN